MSKPKSISAKESKGTKAGKHNYLENVHQKDDGNKIGRKKSKNSSKERLFCCHLCGKTFMTKCHMSGHIRIHEGYRYICRIDMCYKFFTSKRSLHEHKLIHTGERPQICKVCYKAFRTKANFLRHTKLHSGKKPYSCKECPKKFTQFGSLQYHMNIHAGVKHICEICQRMFRQIALLRRHQKLHSKDKLFACAHCAYRTIRKESLREHLSKCFNTYGFEDQYVPTSISSDELQQIE